MVEIIRNIKKSRMWSKLLDTLKIIRGRDKYLKYILQHSKYEETNGIINDINNNDSTLALVLRIFPLLNDFNKIHIVNDNDEKLRILEIRITLDPDTLHYPDIYETTILNEIVIHINDNINKGSEVYINQLLKSIKIKDNILSIKSSYYIK